MVHNYFGPLGDIPFLPTAKINGSCLFEISGTQLIREFDLQAFSMHSSYNPPECRISEVKDLPPHGLVDARSAITSGIWASGLLYSLIFFLFPLGVRDRLTCVPCLKINGHE